jgi:murein DD-endopeptidase MepM/ murein hydrolase activator NlpD
MPTEIKKEKWYYKLRDKYRLVILNDDTFEEKFSFRLSRLNVFISTGIVVIILIVLTIFLIAFTPLREYIPGYADVTLSKRVNYLLMKTDSLEADARQKNTYIENIGRIIEGRELLDDSASAPQPTKSEAYENINYTHSEEDSVLRSEYESGTSYDLYYDESEELSRVSPSRSNLAFFNPLKGIITSEFDLSLNHYGIDIVSKENDAVKATLEGTVMFADWTVETGYVISIQHRDNYISVYKHNSVLLKKTGNFVKAGEPIAIVGESGELTTGAHLHFELWYNGTPVNPLEYIAF